MAWSVSPAAAAVGAAVGLLGWRSRMATNSASAAGGVSASGRVVEEVVGAGRVEQVADRPGRECDRGGEVAGEGAICPGLPGCVLDEDPDPHRLPVRRTAAWSCGWRVQRPRVGGEVEEFTVGVDSIR